MGLNGLVLVGGQSSRMGTDKSSINYQGKAHRAYLAEILLEVGCDLVYFSCSSQQAQDIKFEYPIIIDSYQHFGPISGVLSAFWLYPQSSWLIVGCDYALLDYATLEQLVHNRDEKADATVFQNISSHYLEPLVTIYELSAYHKIKDAFDSGQFSLRKILQILNCNILPFKRSNKLMNVNTREERQAVLKYLGK